MTNEALRRRCTEDGVDPEKLRQLVDVALNEDLRYGPDVTTRATIPPGLTSRASVVAREAGIVCGLWVVLVILDEVGFPLAGAQILSSDGDAVAPGQAVLRLDGPLESILLAERTLLNFLCRLSGIASATNTWVQAVAGTQCRIRDTRKTTPGHRQLEKYAVRCGGGMNHRLGLGDAALIKDNHIAAAGGITAAVGAIREFDPRIELEVECDTPIQVGEAAAAGCSLILLDNMDLESIRQSLMITQEFPAIRVEASGGITLARARSVAETGVDFIAVGSLTHSIKSLDFGLDV